MLHKNPNLFATSCLIIATKEVCAQVLRDFRGIKAGGTERGVHRPSLATTGAGSHPDCSLPAPPFLSELVSQQTTQSRRRAHTSPSHFQFKFIQTARMESELTGLDWLNTVTLSLAALEVDPAKSARRTRPWSVDSRTRPHPPNLTVTYWARGVGGVSHAFPT